MWIADGIARGTAEPWVFELEMFAPDGALTPEAIATINEVYADDENSRDFLLAGERQIVTEPVKTVAPASRGATAEELDDWVATFISHHSPGRLRNRIEWMRRGDLGKHARALVTDTIDGHYPADRAVVALAQAYRTRGGTDPHAVERLLSAALGTVLDSKVGAP
jgi:hypothetical protein